MTTATALMLNIPLMVLFLGLWTGIPLWMVLKRAWQVSPHQG